MKILFCDTSFEDSRKMLRKYLPDDEILYCPKREIERYIPNVEVAISLMSMR